MPYYVYALQLLVRKDDRVQSFADLKKHGGKVGTLTGSAADKYMKWFCGKECEVRSYDGNTDAMEEVRSKKLDAVTSNAYAGARLST